MVTPEIINADYQGSGTVDDPFLVTWIDNDPRDPMRYSSAFKWALVSVVAIATLAVSFDSSAYAGGTREIAQDFYASDELVSSTWSCSPSFVCIPRLSLGRRDGASLMTPWSLSTLQKAK